MRLLRNYFFIVLIFLANSLLAQNYQAIHGSSYAGSLSPGSNPASIVHVPIAWDVTPFAVQVKQSTNAFEIGKYSLLSSPGNAEVKATNGVKKRFLYANQDIHLLNTRISLNSKAAIAFGANMRSYMYVTTSESNYIDTIHSLANFMSLNINRLPLSGEARGSAWAEIYGTYAQTIMDDGDHLLNAGLTLKVNRGLAGGYIRTQDIGYAPSFTPAREGYSLTSGSLQYGYSANFDNIDSNKNFSANRKVFLDKTYSSITADAGFEYILLSDEDKETGNDYAYETKLGLSILDIGSNKYRHGNKSRLAIAGKAGITDTLIEHTFANVASFNNFNDSLGSIANSFTGVTGDFFIYQPIRLVINLDQHITTNFFINAELTVPLASLASKNALIIKDINLLAVTPRWEIKTFGAYLPLLFNTRQQFWVGAAFKAGPILFGTHNLGSLFSKNKSQDGGLYLALTIRPGKSYERQAHYPKDKLSRKERRGLECPKF